MSKKIIALYILMSWISFNVYGHGYVGYNYTSTQGMSSTVTTSIVVSFIVFALYVVFRVWRSLKKDKHIKDTEIDEDE